MAEKKEHYGFKLIVYIFLLMFALAYTSFYMMQNFYSKTFFTLSFGERSVYILESDTVDEMYSLQNMDIQAYKQRLELFTELAKDLDYRVERIHSNGLQGVDKDAIVLSLDMMALSDKEVSDIESYVADGGRLLFNFTSGFLHPDLSYRGDALVSRLTGLRLDGKTNSIRFDANASAFVSPRLHSPLTTHLQEGVGMDFGLYDPLPLFVTPEGLKPDAYMTNWSQVNYVKVSAKESLRQEQSGLVWHGNYKKGKWVYFSFPSYVFVDSNPKLYKKLFQGILEYLSQDMAMVPYPYIDSKNMVFVSEDTEYKFENLKQFSRVSQKHNFPVTAFCVAELAQKNQTVIQESVDNPFLEFASHSYTHKKIVGEADEVYVKETQGSKQLLDQLTGQGIVGFRPPREEIDEKMIRLLQEGGYRYVLSHSENRLSPYFMDKTLIVPRHGTDDYTYLINLDWDSSHILDEMILQVDLLSELDAIYAMSTHTHLMTYGSNISILDKFFAYVNSKEELTPRNGKELMERVIQRQHLEYVIKQTPQKFIIALSNTGDKPIGDLHLTLFAMSTLKINGIESEMSGLKMSLEPQGEDEYTLRITSLAPKSQTTLFINYENTP